jgi:hypothetical protein
MAEIVIRSAFYERQLGQARRLYVGYVADGLNLNDPPQSRIVRHHRQRL